MLVQIDNEPYAFPLAGIMRPVKLESSCIEAAEGLPHFTFEGQQIGLVAAHRLLEAGESGPSGDEIAVVVVGDLSNAYGLVVDRFLGERELVVVPLDPRLGKVACISAAALMEDGSPVLILDVEDMLHAAEKLAAAGRLGRLRETAAKSLRTRRKRVLVVDNSLTVRELERKLLAHHGYDVETAVDGMDGWNAVRAGRFDLVITDVNMPRMDGIELVGLIKKDPVLRARPVMIVSYKDREVDRVRGLDAGADYYLVKSNFQDVALVQAVVDLIGDPES